MENSRLQIWKMADDKTVQVLKELNLEHLAPRFEQEKITLDIIKLL